MNFHRFGRFFAALTMLGTLAAVAISGNTPAGATPTTTTCPMWIHLIDVSSNQPHPIVWWKVEKAGIAGAYIKATEGVQYVNQYFLGDAKKARSYGIPWGGYDYALPKFTNPVADAKFFVKAGGARGELPPALDLETTGSSPSQTLQWTLAWMAEVKKLSGKTPLLYMGAYFQIANVKSLAQWNLWLPAYPHRYQINPAVCSLPLPKIASPWSTTGWSMWQFTSRALIAGVGGAVDASVADPFWFNIYTGAGFQPPSATNPHAVPIYALGSYGTEVRYIQRLLVSHGFLRLAEVNAKFDPATKTALEKYQHLMGIHMDGIWGPTAILGNAWWNKYLRPAAFTTKLREANYPVLKIGVINYPKVRQAQIFLRHAKAYGGKLDGVYGAAMRHGVSVFQHRRGIHETHYGIIDYRTWAGLWKYTH